jgi:2'-5' RNA ligase
MYNDFKQCLNHMGFETENRNYSPHLTLGRVKEIRQLNQLTQLITLFKDTEFQRQTVNQIVLFESKLLPEGVDYVPLQKFLLPVSD